MICGQCGTPTAQPAPATGPVPTCPRCRFPSGRSACPVCSAGLYGGERFCCYCGTCFKPQFLGGSKQMKILERYLPEKVLERLVASETGILSERKYTTVLFADLSAFTAMSEETPAETVATTMNALFEGLVAAVHRYDGTVDKFIGDSVMALFGAPVAHDNDPERAVYCGLEMMTFVRDHAEKVGRKLSLAIGINAGPVVAGSLGGDGRFNYTVVGDAVNTAQRLEAAVGPGRILVTKEIHQRVKDVVRFKALPPLRVKGKRNPIDVWEARERRTRSSPGAGEGFIGRKKELGLLQQTLGARSAAGLALAVVGEAGVGRTAFVHALVALLGPSRQCLIASCPPYAAEAPAGLLIDVVARLLKVRVDQGDGAIRDGRAKLVELGLTEQDAALLLAGASRTRVDAAPLEYEVTLKATCAAFLRVLTAFAAKGPVLVVLEDLHWAAPSVKAQVGALLGMPIPPGVALLATLRPEARPLVAAHPQVKILSLEPLDSAATGALVAAKLALAVIDAPVVDRFHGVTHGNPRMILELLQSFIDQGVVFRSRNRWIISPKLDAAAVPPSVSGLVAARIDELDPDSRRFLQAAAVIGGALDPEVVRRIASLQVDLEWVVSQVLDRRMLVADDERPSRLRFVHETYRSVAADGLAAKEKALLHMRAGQYLEETADLRDPRVLQAAAFHLGNGPDHEKASRFLLMAARRLVDVHQVDSAIGLLEKLIEIAAPLGYANHEASRCENELDEGLYHLGMLYLRKGRAEEADDRLQWAYGRSRHFFNGDFRVWSSLGLAQVSVFTGRLDQARKFLEMAALDAEGMRDPGLLAVALLERARLFNSEGVSASALESTAKALELEQKIPPEARAALPQRISRAMILIERATAFHVSGNGGAALSALEEAYQLSEPAGEASTRGQSAIALGKLAIAGKAFDRAAQYFSEALRCFRQTGDRVAEGRCVHNIAVLDLLRGDKPRAAHATNHAERIFSEVGHRAGLALVAQVREMLAGRQPIALKD